MKDAANRFEEIREEIYNLANEALDLYSENGGREERGRRYWYAHILGALGGGYNNFCGGSFIDMESAQEEMQESACECCGASDCDVERTEHGVLCEACCDNAEVEL